MYCRAPRSNSVVTLKTYAWFIFWLQLKHFYQNSIFINTLIINTCLVVRCVWFHPITIIGYKWFYKHCHIAHGRPLFFLTWKIPFRAYIWSYLCWLWFTTTMVIFQLHFLYLWPPNQENSVFPWKILCIPFGIHTTVETYLTMSFW